MTFSEIMALKEQGFTPDQIMALAGALPPAMDQKPEEPKEPEPPKDVKPEEPQEPKEPEQPKEPNPLETRMDGLENRINEMIKTMQQTNLQNGFMQSLPGDDLEQKAENALAEIIRPTFKKEA